MDGYLIAWRWLAHAAVGGLIVLALGSLAAKLCRQPVRRARIVVLTLLGGFAVPWLGTLPIAPKWSAGFVLTAPPVSTPDLVAVPTVPTATAPPASIELPQVPIALEGGDAGSRQHLERSARQAADGRRVAGPWASRLATLSWNSWVLAAYAATSAGLAAWWLLGQFLLWRIARAARPVSFKVHELFLQISGSAGRAVVLLESDTVKLPFTFTWVRPVIVLPTALCGGGDSQELRFCLAHEWSHIERRDARAWNLTAVAGFVLFYQPLFWWLRRQLRLCQDYLADDRARALASAEDYAMYLVRLARERRMVSALPALGVGDRRSNLYRRIAMLVQDHEPLEHRCRKLWSLATAVSAAVLIVVASGLKLDAAAPAPADDKATAKKGTVAIATKVEGARTWNGHVTDNETGKPIAGAEVVVEISVSRDKPTNEPKTLREVHHTTGADGSYQFTVTLDEAAERLLYITLRVEARDHVGYFGGYGYGMILKNEKLGERPFYENLELSPGKAVEGLVRTPEGEPAAGVKVQAFSAPNADRIFDNGRWAETKTDARGHFRLMLHPQGKAVVWILPQEFAPETHGLKNDRRGDLGTFTLDKGVRFSGRLTDAQGKPVVGVYVEADLQKKGQGEDDAVPQGVADMKHRSTMTEADGLFAFRPLPPGTCRVYPSEQGWDPSTREGAHDPIRRPLPAVFTAQTVKLEEGKTPDPVEIRAVPHVVVEAQLFNSKWEKRSGHEIDLSGRIDGGFWFASCHPTPDGAYRILAPHGLENAQVTLVTNEHSALQFRTSKDAPLRHSRHIRLGTLDHDVMGIEIVRYEAPIILVSATTKDGKPVKGFNPSVDYVEIDSDRDGKYIMKGGVNSDVSLEEQRDGRYRTSQLVPDREVMVTVKADGYGSASRKLTLNEGKTEEVTLVLEPK
jgi:beta-lactamase regulating signal transducer with metallopeptidase domain